MCGVFALMVIGILVLIIGMRETNAEQQARKEFCESIGGCTSPYMDGAPDGLDYADPSKEFYIPDDYDRGEMDRDEFYKGLYP